MQALCSTNDIEIGVLRVDPSGRGWIKWKKADVPEITETLDYKTPGFGQACLVYAELGGSGELAGRIITVHAAEGEWHGILQRPSGESLPFVATVDASGRLCTFVRDAEEFAFSTALQITVTRDNLTARGWVHNTDILSMRRVQRLPISSVLRLINREETEDDDVALLDYFAIHALDHLKKQWPGN